MGTDIMKNDFSQYVDQDSVMTLKGKTKLEVMDQLISRAADLTKLNRDMIFRLTWKREQMMTTGVGNMLALPHIRVNDILHPYVIVGVCEEPIEDYQGLDDQPVRVIVFTVAPDENQEAYLQLLSGISRRLRNPKLIEQIIGTVGNTVELLKVIQQESDPQ
jgi:PTS system nitrogen regulatory IIA component